MLERQIVLLVGGGEQYPQVLRIASVCLSVWNNHTSGMCLITLEREEVSRGHGQDTSFQLLKKACRDASSERCREERRHVLVCQEGRQVGLGLVS